MKRSSAPTRRKSLSNVDPQRQRSLLLRGTNDKRMTWEETFHQSARESEVWSAFDATIADGMETIKDW